MKNDRNILVFKIGDYIEFGRYYNEPILWECVQKDINGALLVSEYIICLKAFDAAESSKSDRGNTDEEKWGSNKWENSNLREWLNSPDEKVNYSTQPPTKSAIWGGDNPNANDPAAESAVWNGYNAYVDEPGFLTNFNQGELEKIKIVEHYSVRDKVFLLSKEELEKIWESANKRIKYTTRLAVEKSDYKRNNLKSYNTWFYWTCTPFASSGFFVTIVYTGGYFRDFGYVAYIGYGGVVPALNLKSDLCKSGKGSKKEPYTI